MHPINVPNHPTSKICSFCKQTHDLSNCKDFMSLTVDDRWHFIKRNKICHRCLKRGFHIFKTCNRNKLNCQANGCDAKHHMLLHDPNFKPNHISAAHNNIEQSSPSTSSNSKPDTVAINATDTLVNNPALRPLLKVVAVTVSGPAGSVDTFALLDDGSTATLIDSDIASRIGAEGPQGQIHLDCVGGLTKDSAVQYVDFEIKGRCSDTSYPIQGARSIKDLGLRSQSAPRESLQSFPYLADIVHELCYDEARPMLIIGVDNWPLIVASETRSGSKSQPVAIRTQLGWVLFGFSSSKTRVVTSSTPVFHMISHDDPRHELEALIKEQYRLDAIGITKHELRSVDDERAVQILRNTTRRLPNGRFQVGLLWKSDNITVPDSYSLAFSRFKSLESKMIKDPAYAERYRKNIHDMLAKGYAEECTGQPPKPLCWYLPHFGVVNPNKPAKLRVVHDAAAKTQGVSLNSLLLPGPDFLQPILGILMRFREGKIALTADIKEMFPQVKIQEDDRDAQRFLWRDDPNGPIKTFRMSSMIFGACSSPSTAIFVLNKNASEFQDEFPEAVEAIASDTYMDDYIGSVDSVEKAKHLAANICEIHKRGGFEMRGWVSNNPDALELLHKELLSDLSVADHSNVDLGSSLSPTSFTRTLGLFWDPVNDVLGFNPGIKQPHHFTKREVLAQVMRIYDPLGLLAPIVVRGRILFQNLWRKGLGWDERLSDADQITWNEWFESRKSILQFQVPRCYNLSDFSELELHVFCDASELAHVAVAYWRFVLPNGEVKLALVASKARVSPLKPASIPRLELQGALIASRLATTIGDAHRIKPSRRFFWTDSMTVLGWLRSDARNFKPFVAHRVGEILENSHSTEWRWVPSELNVADDATRGTCGIESRWIFGPDFLLAPISEWPAEKASISSDLGQEELKSPISHDVIPLEHVSDSINVIHSLNQLPLPVVADVTHFSSWIRLVRATARVHVFLALIFKNRGHIFQNFWVGDICLTQRSGFQSSTPSATAPCLLPLKAEDILRAERHLLARSQLNVFQEEMLCLMRHQPVPRKSRLVTLSPVLKDGLLCLAGRTSSTLAQLPVILDGKEPLVRLLILHYHEKFAHCNTESVINELRQKFWILGIRNAVRWVIHRCQTCKLLRRSTLCPPMGDLPEERLAHHQRPFTFTGIDYFGPVEVAIGRRKEKRWVALFTCMVTRAIHLEIVASLSADAAIMCLRRFIARRGTPSVIFSDNGTSFVGASRQLRVLYDIAVSDYAATNKIVWRFIPPSAPFMGGVWERLVRSVKSALKVTLRERNPREEVLMTLLSEVEAILNSRPLTHIAPDPDYPEALTPNHFLIGGSSGQPFPADGLCDTDLMGRSCWRKALRLADHFWRRWMSEYLPTLAPRRVPGVDVQIKVGDPVLIGDGDLPRGTWPRGVVEALFPGRDGVVRVVDVRTASGVLRRPLRKIVLL
ncbi:uncharacterized protein LOC114356249 [Ostrinia furnacalis]|uniref:uncharacterized protein LOC114356249 n=1 Tax=Ostrinia furnacalis TaxID=93504 RepID=UPI001040D32B|nr:uncharacterized protein LOC114356249 [Ostrinia furnacalis]